MKHIYITTILAASSIIAASAGTQHPDITNIQMPQGLWTATPQSYWVPTTPDAKQATKTTKIEHMPLSGAKIECETINPVRKISQSRADDELWMKFQVIAPEGVTYSTPSVEYSMIDDENFIMDYADVPSDWKSGDEFGTYDPVVAGHYTVSCVMAFETEEEYGHYYMIAEADITPDNLNVVLDMNQCTRKIDYRPQMANGEVFPTNPEGDIDLAATFMYLKFESGYKFMSDAAMTSGLGHWTYYINDAISDDAYITYMTRLLNENNTECTIALASVEGPFDTVTNVEITADDYKSYNPTFSLTEAELEKGNYGLYQQMCNVLYNTQMRIDIASSSPGNVAVTEVPVNIAMKPATNTGIVRQGAVQLGSILDKIGNTNVIKNGGNYVRISDDEWRVTTAANYKVYRDDDGALEGLSYVSKHDVLNVNPALQPIRNYYNSTFLNCIVMPQFDMEGEFPITNLMAAGGQMGTFYELYQIMDIWPAIKCVKYNGEDVGGIDGLMGKPFLGAQFEFDFSADGVLVRDEISTTADLVYAFNTAGFEDIIPPFVYFYKVTDNSGAITNVVRTNEEATLYVNYQDMNSQQQITGLCDVKVEISAQDADEWTEITVTNEDLGKVDGALIEGKVGVDVTGVDKWQKVRVTITDAQGNYTATTINYALMYSDTVTGIANIADVQAVSAIYYDLSGRLVVNPSSGMYIKVSKCADGTTKTQKVAIR